MAKIIRCPKTGEACENVRLCALVNKPLDNAIPTIRQRAGGVSWRLATTVLERELATRGDELAVDLSPNITSDGDAIVCPDQVLGGDLGQKLGVHIAAQALSNIMAETVANVTADLSK